MAGAEPLDGPALTWARGAARELGIDLVAGSIAEHVEGAERGANTSVHIGPDGEDRAVYRKIHMFDVEVGGRVYRESDIEAPGDEPVLSETADGAGLGLSICYDLRFPELYRLLAVEGAKILTVASAFTLATTREHWEVLLRARAIEDQCFVVAANQVGEHAPGLHTGGRSMIVDPWGVVLAQAPDTESVAVADLDLGRLDDIRAQAPFAGQPPGERVPPAAGGPRVKGAAVDKRRLILDGAVRVFARQGFHTCRVSDIADEAGVAYGLVYHYFQSKDEVLDTLFLERWELLLATIADIDAQPLPARDKLHAIASFIIDSYRHDPELMKVIIIEVTRAANTFGSTHIELIRRAYQSLAAIVASGPGRRLLPLRGERRVRRHGLLRHDRAGAHGLDLRLAGGGRGRLRPREGLRRRARSATGSRHTPTAPPRRLPPR